MQRVHPRLLPVTATLLALIAALVWALPRGEAAPPADVRTPSEIPDLVTPAIATTIEAAEPPPQRTDTAIPPPPEADLDHPFAFELTLHLVDEFGLPVSDALVFSAPPLCGLSLWPEPSDARGLAQLQWRGRLHAMQLHLTTMCWGERQPMHLMDLEAGQPLHRTLVVRGRQPSEAALDRAQERTPEQVRTDAARVRIGRMRKRDDLDVLCGRTQFLFRQFECGNCHDRSVVADYATLARCGDARPGLHPAARFWDLRDRVVDDDQLQRREQLAERSAADSLSRAERRRTETATVAGTVRDARGETVAEVPVAWLSPSGEVRRRTMTNTRGQYRLENVAPGPVTLRAGGGASGESQDAIVAIAQETVSWNPHLTATSIVRGMALDETGGVLAGWRVEFERLEQDYADLTTVRDDGTFALPGVPGIGQCLLWPRGGGFGLPVLFGGLALPDGPSVPLALAADNPTRARIRLRPVLPVGCEWAQVETRVTQLQSGRTAALRPSGHDDAYEIEGLAAGPYRVEVGAPVLGWVDCGTLDIDGRGLWDLGPLALPLPGRVRVTAAAGEKSPLQLEHAFCRRLPTLDVQESYRPDKSGDLLLPAGEHVLLWRTKGGLRSLPFTVASGTVVELRIER